jgi:hypothetical protein
MWFESDRDNISESDNPQIIMSQDGGAVATFQGIDSVNHPFHIMGPFETHKFFTAPVIAGSPPTFGAKTPIFYMSGTGHTSFVDFDMNTNNILNAGDVELDSLTKDGAGPILVNDDTTFKTNSVKMTSVAGQDSITAPGCLHLQSDTGTCIWLQADRDNVDEADKPFLWMTQDGGGYGSKIGSTDDNKTYWIAGNGVGPGNGIFKFYTGQIVNNGDAPPDFTNLVEPPLLHMTDSFVNIGRNLDMLTNDISNVGNVELDSLSKDGVGNIIVNSGVEFYDGGPNLLQIDNTGIDAGVMLNMGGFNIDDVGTLLTREITLSGVGPNILVNNPIDMTGNNLVNVGDIELDSITKDGAGSIIVNNAIEFYDGGPNLFQIDNTGIACGIDLDLGGSNILDVTDLNTREISLSGVGPNILVSNPFDMQNNDILNNNDLETESITANTANITLNGDQVIIKNQAGTDTFMTASTQITLNKALNMGGFDIINGDNITYTGTMNANDINCTGQLGTSNLYDPFSTEISVNDNLNMETNDILNCGTFKFQTIPTNDNTENRILVLNTADNAIEYRDASSLDSLQEYQNEQNSVFYSTSATTYQNTANPITYANMPLGDYAIWFSAKAGNTNKNASCEFGLSITQSAVETFYYEATTPALNLGGDYVPIGFVYKFTNASNVNTDIRVKIKASASTAILDDYNMICFRLP